VEAADVGDADAATRWCLEALRLARATPASRVAAFSLIATVVVASLRMDHEQAACLYGVVRDALPATEPSMPPEAVVSLALRRDESLRALGADRFEAEAERGARTGWVEGVETAWRYIQAAQTQTRVDPRPVDRDDAPLTERQREVLQLLAAGGSNKEIAAQLGVAPKTVMHHTTAIYRALGVRSRSEATAWAFRAGLSS
jgi:DNA-binding NarL/FixJ family response regulator